MKIPVHIAEKLLQLSKGESIPSSSMRHPFIEELVAEGIIERNGRIQKKLRLTNRGVLDVFLQNKYSINNLQKYIQISQQENASRNQLVAVSSDSKLKRVRTFKGFLVNCYLPVPAKINGKEIILHPATGTFSFIYDFETFIPEKTVTIIGIENPENFRHIEKQKYLFKNLTPLFVSRYPQNQSKDLIKWLQGISNPYLHFGDFDFAGIGIYLNEFKKYLNEKSAFVIPENIESLIAEYGNKRRYDKQKINFDIHSIHEESLKNLINLIHKYKKGLDQEILIKK